MGMENGNEKWRVVDHSLFSQVPLDRSQDPVHRYFEHWYLILHTASSSYLMRVHCVTFLSNRILYNRLGDHQNLILTYLGMIPEDCVVLKTPIENIIIKEMA